MIYPDVDLETWRARYKLTVKDWTCSKCGKPFQTTVPIAMSGYAGLSTPIHECGPGYRSVVLTPKTEAKKAFWLEVLS